MTLQSSLAAFSISSSGFPGTPNNLYWDVNNYSPVYFVDRYVQLATVPIHVLQTKMEHNSVSHLATRDFCSYPSLLVLLNLLTLPKSFTSTPNFFAASI